MKHRTGQCNNWKFGRNLFLFYFTATILSMVFKFNAGKFLDETPFYKKETVSLVLKQSDTVYRKQNFHLCARVVLLLSTTRACNSYQNRIKLAVFELCKEKTMADLRKLMSIGLCKFPALEHSTTAALCIFKNCMKSKSVINTAKTNSFYSVICLSNIYFQC